MSSLYACSLTRPALDTAAAAASTAKLALRLRLVLYRGVRGDDYILAGGAKHGKG